MDKHRILIIDDSADLVEALEEILHMKGYETSTANHGTAGVTAALTEHPDLIILDLRMPDIDGFEVIRQIRKDEWGVTAKILVLTASGESDEIPHDIDFDRDDFLMKTEWGLDNLAAKIHTKIHE